MNSSGSLSNPRPRIGLALGSGASRGLAHIGVLRAIEEAGIQVDVIAGTSMGALVGASFAAGRLGSLDAAFRDLDWTGIAALLDPVFPKSGLIDGQKVTDFLRAQASVAQFDQLPTPFRAVATDLTSGAEVVLGSGDLIEAVRASIAVPGLFTPVRRDGQLLVDGGLVNPVPVSVVRALGATTVIAVDVNHDVITNRLARLVATPRPVSDAGGLSRLVADLRHSPLPVLHQLAHWLDRESLPGMIDVLLGALAIMQSRIAQATLIQDPPQVLIQPPLSDVRFMDFDHAEEIIDIGYRTAVPVLAGVQWDSLHP